MGLIDRLYARAALLDALGVRAIIVSRLSAKWKPVARSASRISAEQRRINLGTWCAGVRWDSIRAGVSERNVGLHAILRGWMNCRQRGRLEPHDHRIKSVSVGEGSCHF